ncbi:putative carboxylesterase 120 [Camellia lanceoleosa]|uniref:Carboxylesterase 120 n=1 Tax=Camellia lanceoleosa TaxID=1840588 RepID=A0ACC0I6Z6_9ERIC|nr:putative carboxylesterase 120 [Camellia lanceoleosa]
MVSRLRWKVMVTGGEEDPLVDSQKQLVKVLEKKGVEVLSTKVPSELERTDCWRVFYQGAAFPTLARALSYDYASDVPFGFI